MKTCKPKDIRVHSREFSDEDIWLAQIVGTFFDRLVSISLGKWIHIRDK